MMTYSELEKLEQEQQRLEAQRQEFTNEGRHARQQMDERYSKASLHENAQFLRQKLVDQCHDLCLTAVEEWFPPTQYGLLQESIGILTGIATGKLPTGQSRLRDNLMAMLAHLSQHRDPSKVNLAQDFAKSAIADTLRYATESGFTIEGFPVSNTLSPSVQRS